MKVIKKIVTFPIIIVLGILSWLIDLIIKAECWVAGVGFLLLAILAILAIIKQQWIQVGIFAGLAGLGVILLVLSANIQIWIESGLERLK
ncbi:MAG: hypothetical protein J5696_08190 [Lachnospiraceae bacterium]|nr:hypothetical protein [Lachnospiraceae bacterium]